MLSGKLLTKTNLPQSNWGRPEVVSGQELWSIRSMCKPFMCDKIVTGGLWCLPTPSAKGVKYYYRFRFYNLLYINFVSIYIQ